MQNKKSYRTLVRNLGLFFGEKGERAKSALEQVQRNITEIRSHYAPSESYLAFKYALINNFEFVIDLETIGLSRFELCNTNNDLSSVI